MEKIHQEEDEDMLERTERTKSGSLAAIGRAVRREGDMHEDGESDTRKLEETEECRQILERAGNMTWATRAWTHDDETTVDEWRHADDQRHSGDALVDPSVERGRCRVLLGHQRGSCLGMQPMMAFLGLECTGSGLDGLQRSQGDRELLD